MGRLTIAVVLLGTLALAPPVASAVRQPCSPPTIAVWGSQGPLSVDVLFTICGDGGSYNVYGKVVNESGSYADWFVRQSPDVLGAVTQYETFQRKDRFAPGTYYIRLLIFQGSTEVASAQYEFAK